MVDQDYAHEMESQQFYGELQPALPPHNTEQTEKFTNSKWLMGCPAEKNVF